MVSSSVVAAGVLDVCAEGRERGGLFGGGEDEGWRVKLVMRFALEKAEHCAVELSLY